MIVLENREKGKFSHYLYPFQLGPSYYNGSEKDQLWKLIGTDINFQIFIERPSKTIIITIPFIN